MQLEIWRRQEPAQRLQLAMRLSQELVEANFANLGRLHPHLDRRQQLRMFAELNYGKELANLVYGPA